MSRKLILVGVAIPIALALAFLAITIVFPNSIGSSVAGGNADNATGDQVNQLSPLEVVNKRMAAYNQHDLDEFMNTYSEEIQVYTYPDIRLGRKGKAHIRSIFEPMFAEGEIGVTIHHQIVQGSFVVNEETVKQNEKTTRYVSIYEVKNGLIHSVRFLRE